MGQSPWVIRGTLLHRRVLQVTPTYITGEKEEGREFSLTNRKNRALIGGEGFQTDNTDVIIQKKPVSASLKHVKLRRDKELEGEKWQCRNFKGRWSDYAENKQGLCVNTLRARWGEHLCSDQPSSLPHTVSFTLGSLADSQHHRVITVSFFYDPQHKAAQSLSRRAIRSYRHRQGLVLLSDPQPSCSSCLN